MLTDAEIAAINKVTRGSAMRRDGTTTERIYRAGYAAGAAAQEARVAELEADAARYQWLRENCGNEGSGWEVTMWSKRRLWCDAHTLDMRIDAARAAPTRGEGG